MSKITSKTKPQTYRKEWESLPEFQGWLQPVPGEKSKAYCSICEKSLHAHKISLLQHTSTAKHTKLAQSKFVMEKWEKNCKGQAVVVRDNTAQEYYYCDTDSFIDNTMDSNNIDNDNMTQPSESQNNTADDTTEQSNDMPPISTQVLDTSKGIPVQNLSVSLHKFEEGQWTLISNCVTNPIGECDQFISREDFKPGTFKLHFDVYRYFMIHKQRSMFPFIEVVFDVHCPNQHYKIPLFLTPFGYSVFKS